MALHCVLSVTCITISLTSYWALQGNMLSETNNVKGGTGVNGGGGYRISGRTTCRVWPPIPLNFDGQLNNDGEALN